MLQGNAEVRKEMTAAIVWIIEILSDSTFLDFRFTTDTFKKKICFSRAIQTSAQFGYD